MADPLVPSPWDVIEKIGYSAAIITGLVLVLKWISQLHLKELNGRVNTLEGVIKERDAIIAAREAKIEKLQEQIVATITSHGHDMRSLVTQLLHNDKANRDCLRAVIERLDLMNNRPCHAEPMPHPSWAPPQQQKQVPITDRTPGPR